MALVKNLSKSPRGFNAYVRGVPKTVEILPGEERDIALIGRDGPVISAWRAAHDVEVGPQTLVDTANAPSVADTAAAAAANGRENEVISGLKSEVGARMDELKSLRIEHETLKAQMVADVLAADARAHAAQDELIRARAGQHAEVDRLNAQVDTLRRALEAAAAPAAVPPVTTDLAATATADGAKAGKKG